MQTAEGRIKRIVAVRLEPGEDLLAGLEEACRRHKLNNGLILTGIGSLRIARFFDPLSLPQKKAGYGYGEPIVLQGPIEIISIGGMICTGESGETLFHVHCAFADQNGGGWGGHLIEGSKVLLTADFVLGEIEGMRMGRRFDEELDVFVFNPQNR
jgi:predicted DNA-binding protein with PD1-like motif